jgi:hypothetical protein
MIVKNRRRDARRTLLILAVVFGVVGFGLWAWALWAIHQSREIVEIIGGVRV